MANFFSKVGSFLGIGSKGSGGTRDSYAQFEKYSKAIGDKVTGYRNELRAAATNPALAELDSLQAAISGASAGSAASIRARGAALPGAIKRSALASTNGARLNAAELARTVGGGRGGLAFGGGAGAIAARAGGQAASVQADALTQALMQGEQLGLEAEGMASGIEQQGYAMSNELISRRAMLREQDTQRLDQIRMAELQAIAGLGGASMTTGLQNDTARQARKTGLVNTFFG